MVDELNGKRVAKKYPGVYFRLAKRKGKTGIERVYYVTYWQGNRKREVKVGRQFADDMSAAKAAGMRARFIENDLKPPQDRRKEEKARLTIEKLWNVYNAAHTGGKRATDNRYMMSFLGEFRNLTPEQITTGQLEGVRDRLLADEKSPQTVKHILSFLQRLIRFGAKRGICELPL
ncbi:MAG: hypothetical protein LBQ10_07420 [Desulfovibrio sp.]|nr:hypothetical protein [Desulfovibrio sp.]